MTSYNFTVDAELLRELGERLVGRTHIALAELIKNSYDADATKVEITFTRDEISVVDNGHGMSESHFEHRWMRIGTTRKRHDSTSPGLRRDVTGSKGVGRLAAQLLARNLVLESVARSNPADLSNSATEAGIQATIDWDQAVRAGDLTSVTVPVDALPGSARFANGSPVGTRVTLSRLTETWDKTRFSALAQEIWALKPPFAVEKSRQFDVVLTSDHDDIVEAFSREMNAIFDIWNAKITGRLLPAGELPSTPAAALLPFKLPVVDEETQKEETDSVTAADRKLEETRLQKARAILGTRYFTATVELRDESSRTVSWRVEGCDVDQLEFEIRVFDLIRRQPRGIAVDDARSYLRRFGGVAIYDNNFRLPYYGADEDWLKIERDHSARLDRSRLVPEELKITKGLQDLPTNRRLFGWAAVSTSHEERHREQLGLSEAPGLTIQVTRDRLADNDAYHRLQVMIRAAVDLYAMEKARSKLPPPRAESEIPPEPPSTFLAEVLNTLVAAKDEMPEPVFQELKSAVDLAVERTKSAEDSTQAYSALLGALATAGMTSLAYEHEMSKQVGAIRGMATSLELLIPEMDESLQEEVGGIANAMRLWERRVRAIRQVFTPLITKDTRESVERYRARVTVESIVDQLRGLARGVTPDTSGIPTDLRLPRATYPAWSSIFQNVILNAYNALHDQATPDLRIDGGGDDHTGWLRVMDNGAGVDLNSAPELWKPFERRLVLPPELEAAGLGGMGMGLTIVRMIADDLGVRVAFVPPPPGMNTALKIEWKGKR